MVKIYTRSGDSGDSSLFGGDRVPKYDPHLEAYGTLDELNAFLGWFRSGNAEGDLDRMAASAQDALFAIGSHLATPPQAVKARSALPPLDPDMTLALERAIDALDEEIPPLTAFVLPGGSESASILHVARTVCRRAERFVVELAASEPLDPTIIPYLNRLSDLLFTMARAANHRAGRVETTWPPDRPRG